MRVFSQAACAACLLQKYKKKSNLTNCLLYLLYLCTRKQQGCLFRLTSHTDDVGCQKVIFIMNLPDDPMMLFSVINMKLRDCYASLDSLCDDMNVDKKAIVCKLAAAGFEYDSAANRFW